MDPKFIKTDPERQFFTKIEGMSDRDLQELHAYYLSNLEKSNEKIRANVQFFFWFSLISIIGSIIIVSSK
jgi:hypothetical protein